MRTNYARDYPVAWLIASNIAVFIVWAMTWGIHDSHLWWSWTMGGLIGINLGIFQLVQITRVFYWQRLTRIHQDWKDSDGNLIKCSSPKHHDKFAE